MFVNKKTSLPVELHRTHFRDGVFVAAIVAIRAFPLGATAQPSQDTIPLEAPAAWQAATRRALWYGTSITVSATVRNPDRRQTSALVFLAAGGATRTLQLTGDRHWTRRGQTWTASPAAPWESMALSWSRAFGGSAELSPGPHGPGGLPHPGGRAVYPWNPDGRGFYLTESSAEGQPLPNIEWPDAVVRGPLDRPRPAGFAPCPEVKPLRLPLELSVPANPPPDMDTDSLMVSHVAPRELIFEQLPAGAATRLGIGKAAVIDFQIPDSPVRTAVRRGTSRTEVRGPARAIHIDADRQMVWIAYGHVWSYTSAPAWVDVTEA